MSIWGINEAKKYTDKKITELSEGEGFDEGAIEWDTQSSLGKQAFISYGYGKVIDLDVENRILTIPNLTVFRNGHYHIRTSEEIQVNLHAGYQYVFLDTDSDTFHSVRYGYPDRSFPQSYLYVCSVTLDSVYPHYNDIQGVNDYTINGERKISKLVGESIYVEQNRAVSDPIFTPKAFRFVGHRGLSHLQPENSIPAFEECGIKGIYGVETDIRITSDGYFVCIHDRTVDRTTDGTGEVSEMTLEQLRGLEINYGYNIESHSNLRIPTLKEVLMVCSKYGLITMLDLYIDTSDVDALVDEVNYLGFEKSVIYTTTSPTTLTRVRELSNSVVMLQGGSSANLDLFLEREYRKGGGYFHHQAYSNYPDAIKSYHERGDVTGAWVVNDLSLSKELFESGIDLIATDKLYNELLN